MIHHLNDKTSIHQKSQACLEYLIFPGFAFADDRSPDPFNRVNGVTGLTAALIDPPAVRSHARFCRFTNPQLLQNHFIWTKPAKTTGNDSCLRCFDQCFNCCTDMLHHLLITELLKELRFG